MTAYIKSNDIIFCWDPFIVVTLGCDALTEVYTFTDKKSADDWFLECWKEEGNIGVEMYQYQKQLGYRRIRVKRF